jgi:hypothetical protein
LSAFDELELELRQLPGVSFVGVLETAATVVVQLGVEPGIDRDVLLAEARRLAELHIAGPLRIELTSMGGDAPGPLSAGRVQLLVVLPWPERQEVEVHLAQSGKRAVGRAEAGGPMQVAKATLEALEALGNPTPFEVEAAIRLDEFSTTKVDSPEGQAERQADPAGTEDVVAVVLKSTESHGRRFGTSAGRTVEEAAARATLQALNRYLERIC